MQVYFNNDIRTNGVFANCNVEISADPPLKGKVSCDCNHEKLECNCNINDSIEVVSATPINDQQIVVILLIIFKVIKMFFRNIC